MWFEQLTGFKEESPEQVRNNLTIEGDSFVSKVNKQRFHFGELQIASLTDLKVESNNPVNYDSKIKVSEIVADVEQLHIDIQNKGALFQAASQFNLLEMVSQSITPEQGIDRYENDYTQGPACAIACGAGTIYRNYFVPIDDQIGQTKAKQIDCLDLIGIALNNHRFNLWEMKNGYALLNQKGLLNINKQIASLSFEEREQLKSKLKIGIQWNTEVTKSATKHKVSQVYCSALPVAYCNIETFYWEYFASLILEATYEATLFAALINLEKYKSNLVYLTLVGGGAFGNSEYWILDSLKKALIKFKKTPLDIKVVSYGGSNSNLVKCIHEI